jgi:antirestriction protein
MEGEVVPRIYVASLADYNAGRLHGRWIRADLPSDEIYREIQEMLAASAIPDAEEWAIHDFEGFGPIRLAENTRIDTLARIVGGEPVKPPGWAIDVV